MTKVQIYTRSWCGYCRMAKALLDREGVAFEEFDVDDDIAREREMIERSGRHTVPQVFINGTAVGGYTDLAALASGPGFRQMLEDAS